MKKVKIKKDIRNKWLKALRSNRYTQCKGLLSNGIGNCPIGVLGRSLGVKNRSMISKSTPNTLEYDEAIKFPEMFLRAEKHESKILNKIMEMNDFKNKSFKEISDYIEENTIGV